MWQITPKFSTLKQHLLIFSHNFWELENQERPWVVILTQGLPGGCRKDEATVTVICGLAWETYFPGGWLPGPWAGGLSFPTVGIFTSAWVSPLQSDEWLHSASYHPVSTVRCYHFPHWLEGSLSPAHAKGEENHSLLLKHLWSCFKTPVMLNILKTCLEQPMMLNIFRIWILSCP